jgi:xanthine/uracil permease
MICRRWRSPFVIFIGILIGLIVGMVIAMSMLRPTIHR